MTIKELSRFTFIKKEVQVIQRQIENLYPRCKDEYSSDKVRGSSCHFPYTERSFTIEDCQSYDYPEYYKKLERLKEKRELKQKELIDEMDKIYKFIDSIDDTATRMVVSLKYVNDLTWEQIGREIGYSRIAIIKIHKRFKKCIT